MFVYYIIYSILMFVLLTGMYRDESWCDTKMYGGAGGKLRYL